MRYALIPAIFLAACAGAAQPIWLKPGTPVLESEQAFLSCSAQAQRQFPISRRIETAPDITLGGRLCDGPFCIGAARGDVFEVDRNEGLRDRAVGACMGAAGYTLATLPACGAGEVQVLDSQPFDTRGLCVSNGQIAARR